MRRKPRISSRALAGCLLLLASAALIFTLPIDCSRTLADDSSPNIPARRDYAGIFETLKPFLEREMAEKGIPGLSIAIVDDQQVVWAEGFGMADPHERKPATVATVYRIGSVSKLFTDIAIMQLVERGELNLDAPRTDYLPNFRPQSVWHFHYIAAIDVSSVWVVTRTARRKLFPNQPAVTRGHGSQPER